MAEEKRLLGRLEAAAYLNVSPRTVDRERAEGKLVPVRVRGRVLFPREQLDRYVREGGR
jgi:excisionase family DNA binding protein